MTCFSKTTVAILTGGQGKRLRSVVYNRPKVLAEVNGKYFLSYLFDYLIDTGFKHVILCTGYLGDQIKMVYGETYGSLQLAYSQESFPLGTAGALRLAESYFKSDSIFVMNGDSIYLSDLNLFWIWHKNQERDASVLLTQVPDIKRFGQVLTDNQCKVIRFEEKGDNVGTGWINSGIYIIDRALIKEIPENKIISLENEIFPSWIDKKFYGFKSKGRFIDIGIPESYAEAKNFFA